MDIQESNSSQNRQKHHPLAHFEMTGPDAQALTSFYTQLFDWRTRSDNVFSYPVTSTGRAVVSGGFSATESAPHAVLYFESDNLHHDLNRAEATGARTTTPVIDLLGVRLARFDDLDKNSIGIWNASYQVVEADDSLRNPIIGFEITCSDLLLSGSFYRTVFGWKVNLTDGTVDTGENFLPGRMIEQDFVPQRLSVVIHADEPDAIAKRVSELGGNFIATDKWINGEPMHYCNDVAGNIFVISRN